MHAKSHHVPLCNPMDCSLPGSSVHGIPQAGILEWVAISFSRGSSYSTSFLMEYRASLIAQSVKNMPAMQQIHIRFLGQEDLLEKEMATYSSILAWEVLWSLADYSPWGRKESDTT